MGGPQHRRRGGPGRAGGSDHGPPPSGGPADLDQLLRGLDGAGYGAYKRLRGGRFDLGVADLAVESVQADPFAPPSRLALTVPADVARLPDELHRDATRRRALADHLARLLADRLAHDRVRDLSVHTGGQQVVERTTCRVVDGAVHLRLGARLPARGRTILGRAAATLLTEQLVDAVADAAVADAIDLDRARRVVEVVEDQVALRAQLDAYDLVAFVADGASLPRRSGVDDRPARPSDVVPFASPDELRVELDAPNAGTVSGMGLPRGVTLIVGGGYHGKSTLLRAVEQGVWDHLPGDGREQVVTDPRALSIRAEDRRRVERVDVAAFVRHLPTGADTADFSTDSASGSTSQAAAISEALEAGATTLLIDEDTAAANLMVRDERMQRLVAPDREPLTPFGDLVAPLWRDRGVSTVLVVGGTGDYFDVADRVVRLDAYRPAEVTGQARRIAAEHPGRPREQHGFPPTRHRVVDPASIDPTVKGRTKVSGSDDAIRFGRETIDVGALSQLLDAGQATGVGRAVAALVERGHLDGQRTLAEALDALAAELAAEGAEGLRGGWPGDLAMPRMMEVACALNRLRTLRVARLG